MALLYTKEKLFLLQKQQIILSKFEHCNALSLFANITFILQKYHIKISFIFIFYV